MTIFRVFISILLFLATFGVFYDQSVARAQNLDQISVELVGLGSSYGVITVYDSRTSLSLSPERKTAKLAAPDMRGFRLEHLPGNIAADPEGIFESSWFGSEEETGDRALFVRFSRPVFVIARKAESAVRFVVVSKDIPELGEKLNVDEKNADQGNKEKIAELRGLIKEMSHEIVQLRELLKKGAAQ